jgi:4-hydroxy-tetrahydrodipicolinate synthase
MKYQSNLPKGIYTATLTPLNNDLSVNYNLLIKHMEWLLEQGSTGICLMGTTGEANSFTVKERKEVLDKVVAAGIDPSLLLVGTGTCSLGDTIELTSHAVGNGVGGVLMLPPFFYKNISDEGLLEYFRLVIEEVDNQDLKIYLYHFPKMTGVPFTLELIEKLLDAYPDEIVGIKDSSGDILGMQKICESLPGFQIYAGSEKFLLNNLRCGGPGCISATFNASIKHGVAVYHHWSDDNADELQEKLTALRSRFEVTSFVSGLKYLYAQWTGNDLWLNMRPPNSLPDLNTREKLLSNFKNTKLL